MDERVAKYRRAFRYLKRGVFPPNDIDEFTFGRNSVLAGIEAHLGDVAGGSSRHAFIEGAYGRGKSHMLKAIEALALRNGFGVCWVTLDGQNHACNHPTRYLHSFLESLRVPNLPLRGLASLVYFWLKSEKANSLLECANQSDYWLRHPILAVKSGHASLGDMSLLSSRIEARDITYGNGKSWFHTVSHRMQFTAAILRSVGLNGVVYLFDELETVATLLPSIRQRYLSYEFLNLLIDGRKHAHCFFAFAATPDFGRRVEEDKRYHGYYSDQYADGCRFVQKWMEVSVELIQLKQLNKSDITRLCKCLRDYHQEAFSWSAGARLSDAILDSFILETERLSMGSRESVRAWVYLLEIGEQYPDVDLGDALDLGR